MAKSGLRMKISRRMVPPPSQRLSAADEVAVTKHIEPYGISFYTRSTLVQGFVRIT